MPAWLAWSGLVVVVLSWGRGIGSATGLYFLEPLIFANVPAFLWLGYYGLRVAAAARTAVALRGVDPPRPPGPAAVSGYTYRSAEQPSVQGGSMRTVLSVVVAGLLAAPLAGQQDPSTAISFGGGIELLAIRDNQTWTPGLSLQASYWFRPATDHLRFRVTTSYLRHTNNVSWPTTFEAFGASAEVVANANRGGTGLYGLAGIGVYRLRLDRFVNTMSDPTPRPSPLRATSPAVVLGVGFTKRIGTLTWFSEARFTQFGNGAGIAGRQMPLTFGVRF